MTAILADTVLVKTLLAQMEAAGTCATLLGIGPVTDTVVRAAFEVAVEEGFPPMFIASRNQVDLPELGGGYLMGGMDQARFVALIHDGADKAGYTGPLFICRDHGGPWQRNAELDGCCPVDQALQIARRSFEADLLAGFNYIHVDPTKCPLPCTREDLIRWTVELVAFCENVRRSHGLPAVDYEIGAEDIRGGQTDESEFEAFIVGALELFRQRELPTPTCVVGQTGTLTRLNRNEGAFDRAKARRLAAIARKHGLGFKEHNSDYLDDDSLLLHPDVGVAGANVAPEFGYVETKALFSLAEAESRAAAAGRCLPAAPSEFRRCVVEAVHAAAPWQKWLPSLLRRLPGEDMFQDLKTATLLAKVCGHYVLNDPVVAAARERLFRNVAHLWGVSAPLEFVVVRVKGAIRRYVAHFRLTGLNALMPEC